MKHLKILVLILGFTTMLSQAQQIDIAKKSIGYAFTQDNKTVTLEDMQTLMQNNTAALNLVKSAKKNRTLAMVVAGAGGFLVGYPLGTSLGGGKPNWALAGAGAALIVASIPIIKSGIKKQKEAVDLYNAGYKSSSYKFKPNLNLNIKGLSMGLSMRF